MKKRMVPLLVTITAILTISANAVQPRSTQAFPNCLFPGLSLTVLRPLVNLGKTLKLHCHCGEAVL